MNIKRVYARAPHLVRVILYVAKSGSVSEGKKKGNALFCQCTRRHTCIFMTCKVRAADDREDRAERQRATSLAPEFAR